jgi:hypothetical protein
VTAARDAASVRVGHATLVLRGPDPAAIAAVAQRALTAALETVGARFPAEWLFVRRIDLDLRARATAATIDLDSLVQAIANVLVRRLEEMRGTAKRAAGHDVEGVIADDVAWFPTEASARGALLRALFEGKASGWPWAAMPWARHLGEVARWTTLELGDALAHAVGYARTVVPIPESAARTWIARWTGAGRRLDLDALPAEVRARVAAAAIAGDGDDAARVRALAHLFAAWPPARDAVVDAHQLDRLAGRREAARPAPGSPSRAGGLVAWAFLLCDTGLEAALWSGIGDERARRAARWAVGRALEAADVGDGDPILRLWSGEALDGAPLARWVFDDLDPEPLHRGALRFATGRGWLAGDLVLAPIGDGAAVMAGEICVDHVPLSVDDALPALVRRFTARLGRAPAGVSTEPRLAPSALDAFTEVDMMALPDRWRAAARAAASVARRLAREAWRVGPRELRGWAARVRPGRPPTIELPRAQATRIPVDLAAARIAIGATPIEIVWY